MRNPVAKNNKNRGGPFKKKDKESRSYRQQKIQKEIDQLDRKWIETVAEEYERNKTDREDS